MNFLATILILFILFCMLLSPAKFISQALNGISAWSLNVLPSILPFMFFTKLLSSLDCMPTITKPFSKVCKKLFKTPPISAYTFLMAILSGYPVGSKMVADLYIQRKITQEEAFKMTSFCSTSGPMFIVGAVGIGMFKSSKIGYILFISHLVGALINGIAFRNFKLKSKTETTRNESQVPTPLQSTSLSDIITNSTFSILSVGCIITIFFVVIECFAPLFYLFSPPLSAFFQGTIEITKGCFELAQLPYPFLATTLTSFIISFGGISTIVQSVTMLEKVKMPVKLFVFQKILHATFSCIITVILLFLFGI